MARQHAKLGPGLGAMSRVEEARFEDYDDLGGAAAGLDLTGCICTGRVPLDGGIWCGRGVAMY